MIDRSLCNTCGICTSECIDDALTMYGIEYDVDELLEQISKDTPFFQQSGGGITISGGDPLAHVDFTKNILQKAKEKYNLNTAIETSCYADENDFRSVIDIVDNVLCDIKFINDFKHKEIIGVSNKKILKNIQILDNEYFKTKNIVLRYPLIPTINDDIVNILEIAQFINDLENEIPLEILLYHEYGIIKYNNIEKQYCLDRNNVKPPSKEYYDKIKSIFKNENVKVVRT